jgi:hypothetical protein
VQRPVPLLITADTWLLSTPLTATGEQGPRHCAVLVGVNEYDHGNLTKLDYAANDASDLADVLKQHGYEVSLLTADQAKHDAALAPTKTNIERTVKDLVGKHRKGDLILIALAGHGLQFDGDEDSYFCPQDARPFKDRIDTLVSVQWLYGRLEKDAAAGPKFVLVDACRNDPKTRGRGVAGDTAPAPPRGVSLLLSCSAGERSFEVEKYRHGVFFHHVIEGLRGKAKDEEDVVTWDGLRAYVKRQVAREVPLLIQGGATQHPQECGSLSGEPPVLLVLKGGRTEPPKVEKKRYTTAEVAAAEESLTQFSCGLLRHNREKGGQVWSVVFPGKTTDAGFRRLRPSLERLSELTHLGTTSYDELTDASVKEIAAIEGLTSVTLSGTKITDSGLKQLAPLKNLEWLTFTFAPNVTDAGLKELAPLKKLSTLHLIQTPKITDAALAGLKKAIPGLIIEDQR